MENRGCPGNHGNPAAVPEIDANYNQRSVMVECY
jgi:hypothetical protein